MFLRELLNHHIYFYNEAKLKRPSFIIIIAIIARAAYFFLSVYSVAYQNCVVFLCPSILIFLSRVAELTKCLSQASGGHHALGQR